MDFEAQRAEGYYRKAVAQLSARDRRSMVAAEIMRAIYWRLLQKIRRSRYEVLTTRHRLSKPRKLWTLFVTSISTRWG